MDSHRSALGLGLLATALLLAGLTAGRRHPSSRTPRLLIGGAVGILGVQVILFGLSLGD